MNLRYRPLPYSEYKLVLNVTKSLKHGNINRFCLLVSDKGISCLQCSKDEKQTKTTLYIKNVCNSLQNHSILTILCSCLNYEQSCLKDMEPTPRFERQS